jgi:hypothetical protein
LYVAPRNIRKLLIAEWGFAAALTNAPAAPGLGRFRGHLNVQYEGLESIELRPGLAEEFGYLVSTQIVIDFQSVTIGNRSTSGIVIGKPRRIWSARLEGRDLSRKRVRVVPGDGTIRVADVTLTAASSGDISARSIHRLTDRSESTSRDGEKRAAAESWGINNAPSTSAAAVEVEIHVCVPDQGGTG